MAISHNLFLEGQNKKGSKTIKNKPETMNNKQTWQVVIYYLQTQEIISVKYLQTNRDPLRFTTKPLVKDKGPLSFLFKRWPGPPVVFI